MIFPLVSLFSAIIFGGFIAKNQSYQKAFLPLTLAFLILFIIHSSIASNLGDYNAQIAFLIMICIVSGPLQVLMFEMFAEIAYPIRETVTFGFLNCFAEVFANLLSRLTDMTYL